MFQMNTPNDPPAATFTATATPSAATVSGRTNFICSRRLALRRSPYRHVASSSRGGLPTCPRSYACHRISATSAVAAATRPARAARARASTFSQRSSRGARFQRLHLGQITHSRPFHSSNASRRPTPSPEGPPSPSSLPLQNAQVVYMWRSREYKLQGVSRKAYGLRLTTESVLSATPRCPRRFLLGPGGRR